MNTKKWMINAVVAALYVAVTGILAPISFSALQFRVSEIFNHLVIFNRKYIIGIVAGVLIANLLFSQIYDVVFGVAHSLLSLLIVSGVISQLSNKWVKMAVNTAVFMAMSFLIAWQLNIVFGAPFWFSYLTVAIGELVVMTAGMPVMVYLDKKLDFNKRMEA